MKKILLFLFAIFMTLSGYTQDFTVENYTVDIYIHQNGYFDVVENYDLNFETYKHGIYRVIQTNYDLLNSEGKKEKRKILISKIEVPNYKFDAPFDFVQKLNDEMEIKIGDKDISLIGPQHYEIKYRVTNAFLFEDSQIRFYWNIKPDGWFAEFYKINFTVHVPQNIVLSKENCFAYSGTRGNANNSTDFKLEYGNGLLFGSSVSNFVSSPEESVTILINLPLNSIIEKKPLWPFWNDFGWTFIIITLIFSFYFIWRKYGKEERVSTTTSYYPPDNMDPAMAGFLINDKDDTSDLISLIPYWGSKGLLKIEEIPKKGLFGKVDTKLIGLKSLPSPAPKYEQEIFTGLFGSGADENLVEVLVSSLKNTFYTKMSSARSVLKEKAQPYYEAESKKIQTITWIVLIILTILLALIGLFFWGPLAVVSIVITCVVLIFLNILMVKKNAKGNRALSELKGFKQFIKVAEENKLKMLLQDDPGYFENTMGYALAFGLFERWAKKFDALNLPPPNWYSSGLGNSYSMHNFSKSFSSSMNSLKSTMVSSPSSSGSSSGGGSSGGGFGGGGGGSW